MEIRERGSHQDPEPTLLTLVLPSGFVPVEDLLLWQSLSGFFAGPFNSVGDFFMKLAHSAQTDVDVEDGLADLLAAAASYPVNACEMSQNRSEPRSECRSSIFGELRPGLRPTRTPEAMSLVFAHNRFGLGNVSDLRAQILPGLGTPVLVQYKSLATMIAAFGTEFDHVIHVFCRYKVSVVPFVTWLTAGITFPRLLWRSCLGFGRWTIRRRRFG